MEKMEIGTDGVSGMIREKVKVVQGGVSLMYSSRFILFFLGKRARGL